MTAKQAQDPFADTEIAEEAEEERPAIITDFPANDGEGTKPRLSQDDIEKAGEELGFKKREQGSASEKSAPPAEANVPKETARKKTFMVYQSQIDFIEQVIEEYAKETGCSLRRLPSESDVIRASLEAFLKAKPEKRVEWVQKCFVPKGGAAKNS